jgi:hypothetical protein
MIVADEPNSSADGALAARPADAKPLITLHDVSKRYANGM